MSEHLSHTPAVSKQLKKLKVAVPPPFLLLSSLLFLLCVASPSSAAILSTIKFEWSYDTTLPGLSGYTIYQESQPIANIPDPYALSAELDVYLEVGAENAFTITAYDNLGNVSTPSPPHSFFVPPADETGNIPPVAKLTISSLSGPAPLTVDVSASKSIDYDGIITSSTWNFGDGGFSSYENDSHTYDTPGTYLVILEVSDNNGAIATSEATLTVSDPQATENLPPTPAIYTTTNSGPAPLDILFDGAESTDSDGTIIDYSWDFGDGSSASGIFANYTYSAIGTFTGQLSVTDDGGASASEQTVITVSASDLLNSPPLAVINATPLTGTTPLTTIFSGVDSTDSDGVIISYNWDFGDGSIASGADVSHQYITSGIYTATLTVTDDMGDTGQAQITITASEETLATTVIYTDDFTTDTSSSYTNINGTLSVLNGTAHGANWLTTLAYHNLSLGSSDHWVEAEVAYNGLSDSAGLLARLDPANKTGYTAYFGATRIHLNHLSGTSQSWIASKDGPYDKGTYALRIVVTGSTIQVYVDGMLKIEKTDTTYTDGAHAGFRIYRGSANTDVTADNLKAGIGTPPPFSQQNTAPVAQDTSFTTLEDTSANGTFIVSDLDGDPLTAAIVSNGTLGTVVITDPQAGTYSYTPTPDLNGTDTFTYKVNDGFIDSNIATVTVTITPDNDSPVALDDLFTTNEDTSALIDVLGNDTDLDGDLLSILSVEQPSHGNTTISNNQILYTPTENYHGPDSFSYLITDNLGGNTIGFVEVTVIPVNDAPTAEAGSLTLQENSAETGILTANDIDGDSLTFSIVTNGALGTAIVTNPATGEYTYTPNLDASGTDTFTFKANDGTSDSNIATCTINIEIPTVSDLSDLFLTDTSNDYENINGTITISNGVAHGSNWQTTMALHKTALDSSDHWAEATLEYNGISDTSGLIARVEPTNQTGYSVYFTAGRINLTRFVGTTQTWLALYDGSYGAGTYAVRIIITGSLIQVYVDGELRIEKNDSTYTSGANIGLRFNRGYANTDVTADNLLAGSGPPPPFSQPNNPPVTQDSSIVTNEDIQMSGILPASDPDGDQLTAKLISNGTLGTAAITDPQTGAYTYTPNANATGIDTFTFLVNDGITDSNTSTVTVTITAVNDTPIATDDLVITNEDQPVSFNVTSNDTDLDGDPLTISAVSQPANGNVTISANDMLYTPNNNFFGSDSLSYTITDPAGATATATVFITITAVNDPPVAMNTTLTTLENTSAKSFLTANDPENDPLTYILTSNGLLGTATITDSSTGAYNYTPNLNVNGTDTFSFKANDTIADSNIATVTVSIEPAAVSSSINDDFTVNSSADYSIINGTLSVLEEAAHGQNWLRTVAYHNTNLGSPDHWVEAEVLYSGVSDTGGVIARVDDSLATGYAAYFSAGRINLAKFTGNTQTWLALYNGDYKKGVYTVKLSAQGDTIEVYINGDLRIQKVDSTHKGTHAGLYLYRGSQNTDITADNFQADTLK